MDIQMNMKIDGIMGSSACPQHKGWSEVYSWSWGMSSNRKSVQVTDANNTSLNEISIVKPIGIDSPGIRLLFAQGQNITNVEFNIMPVMGKREAAKKLVHMSLEGVMIKSIVSGGSIDDDFFKEHITLLFDKINFEYSQGGPRTADGTINFVDYDFGWDVLENKEWNKE